MARVIAGSVAGPLVLSLSDPLALGGSDDPLLITGTATITSTGDGIDGNASVAWNITNDGTVSATGSGIVLAGGGYITNAGTISSPGGATTYGVEIGGAGVLDNTGVISGYYAVAVKMGSGIVVNDGAIGVVMGAGVVLGSGEVVNAGTISGGISLDAGEIVNSGRISGDYFMSDDRIGISLGSGSITNSGVIIGLDGVDLAQGGELINSSGGFIVGHDSSIDAGNETTVINAGTLYSGLAGELKVGDNSVITNSGTISGVEGILAGVDTRIDNSGTIAGGYGLAISLSSGQVANQGTIDGTVTLEGGGTVTNFGTITNPYGPGEIEFVSGSGTLVNDGVVSGNITFDSGTTNNLLVIGPAASFGGVAQATAGSGSSIELAVGAASISGIGTGSFDGFDRLQIDAGGHWTLNGADTIGTLTDQGTVAVAGSFDVSTAIDPASTGVIDLLAGSTFDVAASALGAGPQISFAAPSGLVLGDFAAFGAGIGTSGYKGPLLEDFASGDSVDLQHFGYGRLGYGFSSASGLLQLQNGTGQKATLAFQTASLGAGTFHFASDHAGGVLVTHA